MLEPERSRECVSVSGLFTDTCPALPARGELSMRSTSCTSCSPLDSHFVDGVGDGDVEGGMMKNGESDDDDD